MSCMYCRYWNEHERAEGYVFSIENNKAGTGDCTWHPKWVQTTGGHWCQQFRPKDAKDIGRFWERMHHYNDAAAQERKLRKEAETKLKKLRARLRA